MTRGRWQFWHRPLWPLWLAAHVLWVKAVLALILPVIAGWWAASPVASQSLIRLMSDTGLGLTALTLLFGACFGLFLRPFRWVWVALVLLLGVGVALGFSSYLLPSQPFANTGIFGAVRGGFLGALALILVGLIWQMRRAEPSVGGRYDPGFVVVFGLLAAILIGDAAVTVAQVVDLTRAYGASAGGASVVTQVSANPLSVPAHIVPEWYFLPFYSLLRVPPDKTAGLVLMGLGVAVLLVLPVLCRGTAMPFWRRARMRWALPGVLAVVLITGMTGIGPMSGGNAVLAHGAAVAWFGAFLGVVPWASRGRQRA